MSRLRLAPVLWLMARLLGVLIGRRRVTRYFVVRAEELMAREEWARAWACLEAVGGWGRGDLRWVRRAASCLVAMESFAVAERLVRDAMATHPDEPYPRAQLAVVLLQRGESAEAATLLEQALAHPAAEDKWARWYVEALSGASRPVRLQEFVDEYHDRLSRSLEPAAFIEFLARAGRLDEARARAIELVAVDPRSSSHVLLSDVLERAGELAEALATMDECVRTSPHVVTAWVRRASLQLQAGDTAAATDSARRAVALAPSSTEARTVFADTLTAAGQRDRARTVVELTPGCREGNAKALSWAASYLARGYHVAAALDMAERLVRVEPDGHAHVVLADVLQRARRYDDAIDALQQAARLDPGRASVHATSASLLSRENRFEEALTAFGRALELREHPRWRLARGDILLRLGRPAEALDEFRLSALHDAPDRLVLPRIRRAELLTGELAPENAPAATGMDEAEFSELLTSLLDVSATEVAEHRLEQWLVSEPQVVR